MSSGWSWYISIIVIANILACIWLIRWTAKKRPGEGAAHETTGHTWDGLSELNQPMPRWWLWLFYATIVWGLIYLALYPGLGAYSGLLNWSQYSQYDEEVAQIEAEVAPLFSRYAEIDIPELARNDEAMQTGRRLFANNCAVCHGTDARGRPGFPRLAELAEEDWTWGGSPEDLYQSIDEGRQGVMPGLGSALGEDGMEAVTAYVFHLNGRDAPAEQVERGGELYQQQCRACHGEDGKGMRSMGAPNLTNDLWIYGGHREAIEYSIREGRSGRMPAQGHILGEDRVHLLAAYIYSLSLDVGENDDGNTANNE
ncbi:cytochrome c oxidase cbb3-type subunit 3 [Natronospira proteinivora]|uniref:Cbb3-type cytochrome c oxidase subunit n=1 Tax=Natronospira proteinivora TaxID=1807133 RepID=A0ABT1G853_9GAMM|nr:cytochrome-c oxidase, cbb3-type subunit III [Natronospira proteinivora]MCP1727496.1 cytochrome c oxidase cbb3-type subunit 3 [Natronospira proteinivora]